VVNHDYKAGSVNGVIISVLASSVVNHDYKAGSISVSIHPKSFKYLSIQTINSTFIIQYFTALNR
jgi:hypothetical protein